MISYPRSKQLVWMGLGFGLLFWILESFIHAFIFRQGTLAHELLPVNNPNEIWMRSVIVALLFLFGICGQKMADRRKRVERALQKAHDELERRVEEKTGELTETNRKLRVEIAERGKTEAALAKSEENLQAIIAASPLPIIAVDPDGRVTRWNPAAERTFGWRAEEVLGKPYPLVPEEGQAEFHALRRRAVSGEMVGGIEVVRRKKDGTPVDVILWTAAVRDAEGRITDIMAALEDITERKKAEAALSWQAAVNAAEAELSGALISPKSIEEISDIVLEHAKSVTGSPFGYAGYIDPDSGHLVSATMTRDVWKDCNVPDKEIVFKKFYGLWGWVLDNRKPLMTNHPRLDPRSTGIPEGHIPIRRFLSVPALIDSELVGQISLANAGRDYTERDLAFVQRLAALYALAIQRKRAEDSLREAHATLERRVRERTLELTEANQRLAREIRVREEAEERMRTDKFILQSIFDGISEALVMMDRDLRVRMMNKAAVDYYRMDDYRKSVDRPCYEVFRGKTEPCDMCAVPAVISEGRDALIDRVGFFDPERLEQVAVYPLKDADGAVTGCIYRISDVTRQKKIEQQLMRADRLSSLGQLSGGIAHEIRNPLSGIRLFVDILCDEEKFQRTEIETDVLDEIKLNIDKIDGIIKGILDFARESTSLEGEIRLDLMIEESLRLWYARLRDRGIELKVSAGQVPAPVRGDAIAVQQVINNLIQNAVEAMDGGGNLSIRIGSGASAFSEDRQVVTVTVEDSGPGIPAELKEKIFNPFFTTKAAGTGLGLSISHQIVKQLGGVLTCDSAPGGGTVFNIELPVAGSQ